MNEELVEELGETLADRTAVLRYRLVVVDDDVVPEERVESEDTGESGNPEKDEVEWLYRGMVELFWGGGESS